MKELTDLNEKLEASMKEMKAVNGERVTYCRTVPKKNERYIRILLEKLTDEQKERLAAIEQELFDLADEVTEQQTTYLKGPVITPGAK